MILVSKYLRHPRGERLLSVESFELEANVRRLVETLELDEKLFVEWLDGHNETFKADKMLQMIGPGDSLLLPADKRRIGGQWYVRSRKVYAPTVNGKTEAVQL